MYTRNLLWLVSLVSAAPLYAADVPANTPLAPQQASDYELVLAPQKPSIPKPPLNRQEVYHE